ncbi:MAG TPA: SLBB domain-containing protein [Ferruginibacter sp.]|nr:SLBB domain-containing protein [Ferruginibacter sp.]
MKKNITVLFFLVTLFSLSAHSQQTQISPSQQSTDPSQVNQKNIKDYFQDQNQQPQQGQIDAGADRNKAIISNNQKKPQAQTNSDTAKKDNITQDRNPDATYGTNIFENAATYNVGELSTPPLDYPIGVGDHIIVALWGGGEYQEDYIVAKDGSIFPAGIGKITVQGLTFEEAKALVYSKFKRSVPAATHVQVTLGQPRSINVNVAGEVVNPGPVTVSAFSNAFNVIGLAGGITDFGNLRNIEVKRAGKVIEVLDVYEYLTSGNIGHNIYLQNNDFVLVTFVDKKVLATGPFRRPMYYQLKKNEGIKALLKYSGGLSADAFSSGVKVISTLHEKQIIRDVNVTDIVNNSGDDYQLSDGDIVKATIIKPGISNKVELKGEVRYPGLYELKNGDRLFDLINRAGGITKNTYLHRAYVFRGTADSTSAQSDKVEVSLNDFAKNDFASADNILLQVNDVVQLFGNDEFGEEQYVQIFGEVRKEINKTRIYKGMTLEDLLYLSGGLKPSAEYGRLEISSIVDADSAKAGLKPTRTVIKSYSISSNLELDSSAAKVLLKPYDQVFVRKNPTFQLQQNVQLAGLFKYPGFYSKLNPNERLSSFINRAGGVKDNANIDGAILYRNKTDLFREKLIQTNTLDSTDSASLYLNVPISLDLAKAIQHPNSGADVVLQENDIVYIPEVNPFVIVKGIVQSPLRIAHDDHHSHMGYYIDRAGGFGIRPWRRRIFVTYANGQSRRTRNYLFCHFYPKVRAGSIITVPQRPVAKDLAGPILLQAIATAVPIIVAAIILKNIN